MELIWAYVLVFVFAAVPFFEGFVVIPLGIFSGLEPIPVVVLGLLGNIVTVLLVIVFIEKIKQWRSKRKEKQKEQSKGKRSIRAQRIWKKYGLPGLAMIGPMFVGSHLTAFMSIALGGTKLKTTYWMLISIVVWCAVTTVLAYNGIDYLGIKERNLFNNFNE